MIRILFLIAILGLSATSSTPAATLSSNGSNADVQAKINSAQAGDTVTIPAGTFSGWAINLSKAITLQGAGTGKSIIRGNGTTTVLDVTTADNSGTTRVTGLTFDGGTTEHSVMIRYTNGGAGLMDHCELIGGSGSEMIHNEAYGPADTNKAKGWSNNVTPGSADAVYVEDCTFSKNPFQDQYFWGTSAIQGYYGSRTVFRHNLCRYCHVDQHGTQGMIGARWFEIYENTFEVPDGGNQSEYMGLRGGSGVVFNNKMTGGPNVGGGSIKLYDENPGTSPLYLARGWKQNPSPVYIWANGNIGNAYSGSSNVIEGRDFFNSSSQPAALKRWQLSSDTASTTYAYKPYVYPHPMAGGSPMPTPAPTATPSPPPPSTKFKKGDSVMPTPNTANVRSTAAGDLLGTQPIGAVAKVVDGPMWGQLAGSASGVFWWALDFPSGVDGWVGEDNLVMTAAPTPTPTPAPTATPTPAPTPTPGQTWENWIKKQNDWIRSNPPTPDPVGAD